MIEFLAAWNLFAFLLVVIDKNRAYRAERRIRERTLFLTALGFGGIGILAGMYTIRHKTRHLSFVLGIPVMVAINLAALYWFWQQGWILI